ncbi:MAG: IS110 family transposase [Nitrospirota bacterium]
MKQYEGIKYLNDKHDAFWLARMLRLGILPEGYIYPRASRGTRELLRQRSRFIVQKTSLKHTLQQVVCNQTGVTLSNNTLNEMDAVELSDILKDEDVSFSAQSMLETIRFLEGRIKTIETRIVGQIKGGPIYPVLTSVPGIGPALGMTIALETGPVERFASAGQFASYARCVPSSYWSNAKQKGRGNVKNGNKYLSWAFAEAANFSIRYCKEAKGFYQRKCAKTNQPSAYRAVANKLAKACYFMMKEKKEFHVERLFS